MNICIKENCNNPRWSRETKLCRQHHYLNIPPKKIKKVSIKRNIENLEYVKVRLDYLNEHSKCEVCEGSATEIHHKKGRRGNMLTNTEHFLAVCRPCHNRIENNREWAYEQGYLERRL